MAKAATKPTSKNEETAPRPGDESAALEAAGAQLAPIFQDAEEVAPPPHGVSRAAGPGAVPRVCHPLERVQAGGPNKRFKLRGEAEGGLHPVKYVIAPAREAAEAYYRELCKVPTEARVICTELAD